MVCHESYKVKIHSNFHLYFKSYNEHAGNVGCIWSLDFC